jgi:hypothetical protein
MRKTILLAGLLSLGLAGCSGGGELADMMIKDLVKSMVPEAAECMASGIVAKLSDQQKAVLLGEMKRDDATSEEKLKDLSEEKRKEVQDKAAEEFKKIREANGAKEDKDYDKIRAQIRRVMNDVAPACTA